MKYTIVDSAEFAYPDVTDYQSSSQTAEVFAPRKGYASFQAVLWDVSDEDTAVSLKGFDPRFFTPEIYVLYPVFVERNVNLNEENSRPNMPQRKAPFYLYDCLARYDGKLKLTDGHGGVYVALKIADDAPAGCFTGTLKAGALDIPVSVEVFPVAVPDETLKIIQGYNRGCVARYHHVEYGSDEYNRLDGEYLAMLRRMRQNMMYTGGVKVTDLGEGKYAFDFTGLENDMRRCMDAGMKYFNGPSIGGRKSWHESTIIIHGCDKPAMSYDAYCYLSQYLPALHAVLEKNGWLDRFVMGIADEPNDANATEFRALCGLVRKFVPDIRLIDAMSYGNLHGALDIWVPLDAEYDRHMKEMETLRGNGDEIWHYVCCGPRGDGYINRFMDYALLCTRYLFWGNYRHNLGGYLHWAVNSYQSGISKIDEGKPYEQDPFTDNCPEHHNADSFGYLPAGDTHLIYPGDSHPWMSIRLENQRMSAEEYELLRLLEKKNKPLADEICESVFRSFCDVEFDVAKFNGARRRLLHALCE